MYSAALGCPHPKYKRESSLKQQQNRAGISEYAQVLTSCCLSLSLSFFRLSLSLSLSAVPSSRVCRWRDFFTFFGALRKTWPKSDTHRAGHPALGRVPFKEFNSYRLTVHASDVEVCRSVIKYAPESQSVALVT